MGITVSYRAMTQADFDRVLNGDVISMDVQIDELNLAKSHYGLHTILTGKDIDFVDKNNPLSIAILGWNDETDENGDWYWENCGWWEIWVGNGYNDKQAVKEISNAMNVVDFDKAFDKIDYGSNYKELYRNYFKYLKDFYQMCADNDYAVEVDFW